MLVAHNEAGTRVSAASSRKEGRYFCPGCGGLVVLKRGKIKVPHFAHKDSTDCPWGEGETHDHMVAKTEMYAHLRAEGYRTELEHPFFKPTRRDPYARADVAVWIDDIPYAIEFQHTLLSIGDIEYRAHRYAKHGIGQLWVPFIDSARLNGKEIGDNSMLVRKAPFHKMHTWINGFTMSHLTPTYDVNTGFYWLVSAQPYKDWRGGRPYFDKDGEEKWSKRYLHRFSRSRNLFMCGPYDLDEISIHTWSRSPKTLGKYDWPGGPMLGFREKDTTFHFQKIMEGMPVPDMEDDPYIQMLNNAPGRYAPAVEGVLAQPYIRSNRTLINERTT